MIYYDYLLLVLINGPYNPLSLVVLLIPSSFFMYYLGKSMITSFSESKSLANLEKALVSADLKSLFLDDKT